jgi:hypothetical protein
VPSVGEDLDAQGGAVKNLGVLVPVQQGLAHQGMHDGPEPALRADCRLSQPAQLVVPARQQVGSVGRSCQGRCVLGVVACPGRCPPRGEGGVEVVRRPLLTLPCGDQPGGLVIKPDRTAPPLDLDLKEDLVIDRRDALLRCLGITEALGSLRRQRVGDLVKRHVDPRNGQHETLAQASQGGPRPPRHG